MIQWIYNKLLFKLVAQDLINYEKNYQKVAEQLTKHQDYMLGEIGINIKDIQKLVDRVNQLEQTIQCLSDDNQLLIARLHSKENQNG